MVSIHAFRGEGDARGAPYRSPRAPFQSTPSGGKATRSPAPTAPAAASRFNPRLPGGRRPNPLSAAEPLLAVSIHAFRGEGDVCSSGVVSTRNSFNPRLPGGRRRCTPKRSPPSPIRFNPRLPGGRRLARAAVLTAIVLFQSTPSGGKATQILRLDAEVFGVSIHAFRGEGDGIVVWGVGDVGRFNPRLPGGRRRDNCDRSHHVDVRFNPRLPGGRRLSAST